jgi:nucleoside-diphosphate-sugar epimerase
LAGTHVKSIQRSLIVNKQVLIVGCGDLGTALAHQLQGQGFNPIGVRRASAINSTFPCIQADVTSPASLLAIEGLNPSILVYCVAASAQTDENYRQHYVEGLRNVLNAIGDATNLKHVFFVSSTRMYGQEGDVLLDEDTIPQAMDFGGQRLLEAEGLLALSAQSWTYTALRLTGIYGPGRNRMINLAANLSHWPNHNSWSNRIHRDDAAGFVVYLINGLMRGEKLHDCYIVTDSCPVSQYEVLQWIAEKMGLSVDGVPPKITGGKRMLNLRMLSTGFSLGYPDYKSGYSALLAIV